MPVAEYKERRTGLGMRPAGVALSALCYLGRNQITPEAIAQIRRKLSPSEFAALTAAKASMPGWMAATFYRYERQSA